MRNKLLASLLTLIPIPGLMAHTVGGSIDELVSILKVDEGFSSEPYRDGTGWSIGYGFWQPDLDRQLKRITKKQADALLVYKITYFIEEVEEHPEIGPIYQSLDPVRQITLVNMAYQLGILGLSKFSTTLKLIKEGKYTLAAHYMLRTLWAKQTPNRAARMAYQIRTGQLHSYYK